MTIPEKIKILGITYEIEEVDHIPGLRLGQIDFVSGKIQLLVNASESVKEHTLLHETMHGMLKGTGYDWDDENMVQQLAGSLCQLVRDNPSLFI